MNFAESDEEEDEPRRVKFSHVLQEEEYEDEDIPKSYSKELEDNVEDDQAAPPPEVQGWDPRDHSFFFHIQY